MNSAKQEDTKSKHKKSLAFLYANNKNSEKEIKKTITFKIVSKRIIQELI